MKYFSILIIRSLLIVLSLSVHAPAGIIVFDDAAPVNTVVKLRALTKGRFFPEGGKLVKFYLKDKYIGTTLSGGDGYAFLKHRPSAPGIVKIKAEAGSETDEGVLLITSKKDRVLVIEIEGALSGSLLSRKPAKDSNEIVKKLSEDFRMIYITSLIGIQPSRKWLKENDFPLFPVFKWEGADLLNTLQEEGIRIYAIIAAPAILSEAPDIDKRFSFEETEEGTAVMDWKDLFNELK